MSVFFYGCVSLDGCLADRDHGLGWLYETGTVEETGYEEFYRELEAAGDPAAVYPATENYVFTHRPLSREGFTPVCGSVPEFVESLGGDRNIWVVGGNTLLAPLLERDMVDRMIVQIAPVLLGGGVPLFTQGLPLRRFRLDGVRRYGPFAELSYSKA